MKMPKLMFVIALLLMGVQVWGQEKDLVVGGNYYLNTNKTTYLFLMDYNKFKELPSNTSISDLSVFNNKSYRLSISKIDSDTVYFKFWQFNNTFENNVVNGEQNEKLYSLPLNEFKEYTEVLYDKYEWKVGVYTIPFKLRFSGFDFSSDINLGTNLGLKIRYNRKKEHGLAFEPMVGFGLASIPLNSENSKAEETTKISAFTINTGILIHLRKSINLGLTYGWDIISDNDQRHYDWKYNGKGWLGVGINISFSEKSTNTASAGSN